MDETSRSMLHFPCDFPLKVIGKHSKNFIQDVIAIAYRHDPTLISDSVRHSLSQSNNFCSVHLNIHATSQLQLDDLYRELTVHPDVTMVL